MEFIISAATDVGTKKKTNQDSLLLKKFETHLGNVVFAVLCDGMGGFDKGEVASASVIRAFEHWAEEQLPYVSEEEYYNHIIREQWITLVQDLNEKIMNFGRTRGIKLGTTIVAMVITPKKYFLLNVGDSRAYQISSNTVKQLTKDQTFIAREVESGRMTMDQAVNDPRKNVLLQCVGASDRVFPDVFFGETEKDMIYMFCSDGFRHEITEEEIHRKLNPQALTEEKNMDSNIRYLIDLNIRRNETDNITAAVVRTC